MTLSEDHIQRYSRQILLREVGGRGQAALLAAGVRLSASGASGLVAAAYVAAAGSGVVPSAGTLDVHAAGFLVPAGAAGRPLADVLAGELPAFSPDALAPREGPGEFAELPHRFTGAAPWVALGGQGETGVAVWRGASGCAGCFTRAVEALGAPPSGPLAVGLGALGALLLQRLVLGLAEPLGACAWGEAGLAAVALERCGRCA